MNLNAASLPDRRDVYDQITSLVQNPAATPITEALRRIESCLGAGECLLASNACESLSSVAPSHPRLIQLWALALARTGGASKAKAMLTTLAAQAKPDEETLGLLARTYKDLWLQTGAASDLALARDTYEQAYQLQRGTWPGINAATLALLSGNKAQSQGLASAILETLGHLVAEFSASGSAGAAPNVQLYWDYATVGEAALILDQLELAKWAYQRAIALSEGKLGNLASSRRNAELILSVQSCGRDIVSEIFVSPQVVVFTGHMLDAPGREPIRFPPTAEKAVYQRIRSTLAKWEVQIGFSGAAGGADILFLEALAELGGETNIVLPHPPEAFLRTSVGSAHGDGWIQRYERVLSDARRITVLSDFAGDDVAYYFSGIVMAGLASLRASQVCGQLRGLTAWDMQSGGIGGTGTTACDWLSRGMRVDRLATSIDDEPLLALARSQGDGATASLLKSNPQQVISMLFADTVGYTKLSEAQIPTFVRCFLGAVRQVMERQSQLPLTVNTWGDALYFTFESVLHANEFALDLSDMVNRTPWESFGLPAELNLRIALHAGPAYKILDPVTQQASFSGTQVSRAARIEPVTPPGFVYCSEPHAALVALENQHAYHCEYVGNMPYAKNYGVFPTYSLTRRKVH